MVFSEWYNQNIRHNRQTRYMLIGVAIVAFLALDIVGYRWYTRRRDEHAQLALSRCVELVGRAVREDVPHLWEQAGRDLSEEYNRYSGSSMAPYFLFFSADVALHDGKMDRAIEYMEKGLKQLSKKNALYSSYGVKLALMKMDAQDEKVRAQGKSELHAIASDPKNLEYERALYYEGLALFDSGDRAAAEAAWKGLLSRADKGSSWAEMAQAKLEYLA
ncbi:TPA: hypothetical protein DDZ86_03340 [Candidatus Dependentiae bacterium]|nr:MAG: hypothetical protein UW09_C0003G0021 [candidate division TM6 bacterium GW2011_GWF2_43_87]HBL98651.1 hypothetical protein [Candidatus Dependentiae bacterium]